MKNLLKSGFLQLNFTCRIRIPNMDPDPAWRFESASGNTAKRNNKIWYDQSLQIFCTLKLALVWYGRSNLKMGQIQKVQIEVLYGTPLGFLPLLNILFFLIVKNRSFFGLADDVALKQPAADPLLQCNQVVPTSSVMAEKRQKKCS